MSKEKKLHSRLEGLFAGLGRGETAPTGRAPLEPPGPAVRPAPMPAAGPGALPQDALAVVPGWTWEADARGALTVCSVDVSSFLGFTPDELLGRTLAALAPNSDAHSLQTLAEAISRQRPIMDVHLAVPRRDGALVHVFFNALPRFDDAGRLLGYRGVSQVAPAPAPVAAPRPAEPVTLPPPEPPAMERAASSVTMEPPAPPAVARPGTGPLEARHPARRIGTGPLTPQARPASPPPAPARRVPAFNLVAGLGYLASEAGLEPIGNWTAPEAEQALANGALVMRAPEARPAAETTESGETNTERQPNRTRALAVPIRLQNQTVGVLDFFDDEQAGAWSEDDLALVQAVSDQLGLALENAQLFSETRDYLDKQTLLYEVTHAAASALNLSEALNGAAQALGRVLPESAIAILLLDESSQRLRNRASVGFPADLTDRLQIAVGEGITGWVAQHNQAVLLRDVRSDPRYVPGVTGMVSEAAVPLALGDRVIGVLNVESPRPDAYDDEDLQLLSTLAGTLSAIIVNNNLLAQISQERERLSVLYDVLQGLITRPDRAEIVATALEMAPRLGAQHAYVLLMGQNTGEHSFRATVPGLEDLSPAQARELALTLSQRGLEHWVLANQRPAVVVDTRADARWFTTPGHVENEPARSVISVPLRTQRGNLTGVLAYTHPEPGALGPEQLAPIESIAGQVAVALENALLRQQQGSQNYNAAALARAAQALTRTLSESELHQIVASQLFETFQPNGVALLRWDPSANSFGTLAVQVGGESPADHEAWPAVGHAVSAVRRPDLLQVIHKRHGHIRTVRPEPNDQLRESMVLPLLYGGDIEGVAEVVHTGGMGGLSAADLELFQSILTAAASALQSARLYELQRQTAERLAEVDRLKSQFLANMSHELRTPLNSIIGFSRVILKGIDGPLSDLQHQDLTSINNAGQHLLGLINDILDMARIEAGKMDLVLDEIDLSDTIKGVLSTTVALVKEKPVQLREEVPAVLPKVRADPMRIRQVLLNLLANAAKFTDNGSITLRAQPVQAVGPRSGRLEQFVELSIIDTGMGMAPEDLPKLFEPFSQVDASATRKVGGTGLGLSICRQLVELHNGRIWVESEEGHGSTFTFILPVSQPDAQPAESETPESGGHLSPIVLVVDDDQAIAALYRRYLEPHGYRVIGTSKSNEAMTRAAELRPAAILLDVLMPNKDGWQVLTELKRSEITRDVPVIMCTLVSDPERAYSLGAADYLTKPILEADLLRSLNKLPGHSQGRPASVLMIEDNPDDAAFVKRALAAEGATGGQALRLLEARDGQTGLTLAHNHRPQAIILDLQLPDMDGFQVLTALRNDPLTRDIPVIVVTASELSAEQQTRLARHVSAWRQKGQFQAEELFGDLKRVLVMARG